MPRLAARSTMTRRKFSIEDEFPAPPTVRDRTCRTLRAGALLWARLVATISSAILAAAAQAQNYPVRPITFVVPFAAGGLTDVPARVLAVIMQERTGASIVVENKTGASGVI